uniref:Uncharacterized protein n=1 Tax=Brassica oleracea var. oleracea TaxID=109376 RepID=A0A0D3E2X2_BRAOL
MKPVFERNPNFSNRFGDFSCNGEEMVNTKFTRNGREVMIFGAMRNFDYGNDEAVQESKKVENAMLLGVEGVEDKAGNFIWVACVISGEDHEEGNFIWVAISGEGHEAWFNSVS